MTKRCIVCGHTKKLDEFLYSTREGEEMYLCGRKKCEDEYNFGEAPGGLDKTPDES